jgi:hypothetical protein
MAVRATLVIKRLVNIDAIIPDASPDRPELAMRGK